MRFGIQAVGSEGDVRPLIALGAGLHQAGHAVTISICGDRRIDYAEVCDRYGLRYLGNAGALDFGVSAARANSQHGNSWHRAIHRTFFIDNGNEDRMYEAALSLCADNDVLISHYLCYPAKAAVLRTGAPHASVQLTYEHTPTAYRACRIGMPSLGPRLNLIAWRELFQASGVGLKAPYLRFWRQQGLPPFDELWSLYFSDDLNLLAVSELFCPQQPDWEQRHVVTGFLNPPRTAPAPDLPERVQAFLDAGEPPVFMTFGSAGQIYAGADAERDTQLFVDAAVAAGCRAVIQTDRGSVEQASTLGASRRSNQILFTDWIPYGPMFASCALAVHHAGIGTCQLSLRHNCPSVAIPFTEHHALFAERLRQLGACPQPVMHKSLTATGLAAQIQQVLANGSYRQQAAEAGAQLRREDGVGRAVQALSTRFAEGRSDRDQPAPRG